MANGSRRPAPIKRFDYGTRQQERKYYRPPWKPVVRCLHSVKMASILSRVTKAAQSAFGIFPGWPRLQIMFSSMGLQETSNSAPQVTGSLLLTKSGFGYWTRDQCPI